MIAGILIALLIVAVVCGMVYGYTRIKKYDNKD